MLNCHYTDGFTFYLKRYSKPYFRKIAINFHLTATCKLSLIIFFAQERFLGSQDVFGYPFA